MLDNIIVLSESCTAKPRVSLADGYAFRLKGFKIRHIALDMVQNARTVLFVYGFVPIETPIEIIQFEDPDDENPEKETFERVIVDSFNLTDYLRKSKYKSKYKLFIDGLP
jgi:hypothetical protein